MNQPKYPEPQFNSVLRSRSEPEARKVPDYDRANY
jgi:hypothetical protein